MGRLRVPSICSFRKAVASPASQAASQPVFFRSSSRRDILRSPFSCSKIGLADSLFPHAVLGDLRTIKCWGVGVARRQMSCRNELGCECMYKFCKTSAIRMPRRLPDTTIMLNCRSTSTWRSSNRIRCVGRRLKVQDLQRINSQLHPAQTMAEDMTSHRLAYDSAWISSQCPQGETADTLVI